MTNILILGAGFGGVSAALKLEKKLKRNFSASGGPAAGWKITLVDRNNFHLFMPSLYEVATVYGLIEDGFAKYLRGSVAIPLSETLENKKIDFVQTEIKEVNLRKRFVNTGAGNKLDFDYLIIALGGETEFYGIPGVQDYAFNFKAIDDAIGIFKKIREIYDNYQKENRAEPIKIGIIGGGFTGVELTAELACCVKNIVKACSLDKKCTQIQLFEAGPAILPVLNVRQRKSIEKRLRKLGVNIRLNSQVEEVGPDSIKTKAGGELTGFDLIIWTGGVRGSRLLENLGLKLTKRGTIEINDFLQTKNSDETSNKNIFAIGDSATLIDPQTKKPVPAMAYVAHDQADVAAENIIRTIKNQRMGPYKPFYDAWIAPAGGKWAYFHYKGLNIAGFWGYCLRQLVDLKYFLRILPLSKALSLFFKDLVMFTRND
ncbi:MAG: NADH dehydrogenase [Parcubacteria group bacterium Gr01-1014_2]|nr:MAG: NADH dehydrogenase [Parcubacteria group bacterium Gr01-1014_2]